MGSPSPTGIVDDINLDEIEGERLRIARMLRFCSKTNDLDTPIISAVESVLNRAMIEDGNIMTPNEVRSMLFRTLKIDNIMVLGFFDRSALPFRKLRLTVTLRNVDPVSSDFLSMLELNQRNSVQKQLYDSICLLLFCGAENTAIQEFLNTFRERREFLNPNTHARSHNGFENSRGSVPTPIETPRIAPLESELIHTSRAEACVTSGAAARNV